MLRLFILLRNNYPCWQMGNSNRTVCSIDRLSTRLIGSEYIYTQILVVDLYILLLRLQGVPLLWLQMYVFFRLIRWWVHAEPGVHGTPNFNRANTDLPVIDAIASR